MSRKQQALVVATIAVGFYVLLLVLDYKLRIFHKGYGFLIWMLPFYVGMAALYFAKDKKTYGLNHKSI